MQCPNCRSECADAATECLHCGIVFAKYSQAHQRVEAETLQDITMSPPDKPRHELILRAVTLPAALIIARAMVGAAPGAVRLLTMWVHESGHAITAWLCGFSALPGPWVTEVSSDRNRAINVLIVGLIAFGAYYAIKTRKWMLLAVCAGVFMLEVACLRLFSDQAQAFIAFGGDAGCLVLGSLLMATFYASEESAVYQNSLRWGFVPIGALAFMDAYVI